MSTNTAVVRCNLCGSVAQAKTIAPTEGQPVRLFRCGLCDVRRCGCGHYIQSPTARRCPNCQVTM